MIFVALWFLFGVIAFVYGAIKIKKIYGNINFGDICWLTLAFVSGPVGFFAVVTAFG